MDPIIADVQSLLNQLIDQTVAEISTCQIADHPGSNSPPTDLSEPNVEPGSTAIAQSPTVNANLEFCDIFDSEQEAEPEHPISQLPTADVHVEYSYFSDIFNLPPTQCYPSQFVSPIKKRTEFVTPASPRKECESPVSQRKEFQLSISQRKQFQSPPTSQQRKEFLSPRPPTPFRMLNEKGVVWSPARSQVDLFKSMNVTPKKSGCFVTPMGNFTPNMTVSSSNPQTRNLVTAAMSQLPISDKPIPVLDFANALPTVAIQAAIETAKKVKKDEFCPPYCVGMYQSAPMCSRSNRPMRIGLSKSRKRKHPFAVATKHSSVEE